MVKRTRSDYSENRKAFSKRAKHGPASDPSSRRFVNADEVRTALQSQDLGVLAQALIRLRNQLTVRSAEGAPGAQDERLLLTKSWLEASPGAQDIFSIMDKTPQPSLNILSLCLSVLSSLLNILSTHFIYHSLGDTIMKSLLSPSHMRQLNANLSGASSELILSTLKVFSAMSNFAGGVEQKSVLDGFAWGQKSLQKLLFMRRKGKDAREIDPIARPDIRTLYILFILSFLTKTTLTPIKLSLLEQHRETFLLTFKGISQDPYVVVLRVLEVCWEGIWADPKIKRTLKIGLFSEPTLNHLLKLYDRDAPENEAPGQIPADLVHHFMLAVTTHPGVGICFKDRGWYPRDDSLEETRMKNVDMDLEDESGKAKGAKIYNKILANIVKGLKVNEDARQQELAFRILEACPELVASYWGAANLTLEPRLSSRWITNVSVLGTIISLPIPTSSFMLPHSAHHSPSPPPLSSTISNVLPSVLTKNFLTKGIQSPSNLVQHCTALALSKCLAKLDRVLRAFREVAHRLEEEETGQWLKSAGELETEVERRVPDFMVIVGMMQQKHLVTSGGKENAKVALLTESALRLLCLYHKLFPRLVTEVRFDAGKLLLNAINLSADTTNEEGTETDASVIQQNGLNLLRQLHVLRLLKESDQFAWSSKSGMTSHSHLHAIFTLYTKTPHLSVRRATSDLLVHILSSSILFSHDPAELDLWLSALPSTRRAPGATAPDGTALSDESIGVLAFLDDCIQRCSKTPYRYLEEGLAFFSGNEPPDTTLFTQDCREASPSPLIMTVLEQLRAKLAASLLSPSDSLAIATFMRKLTYALTCKLTNLRHAWKITSRLVEIFSASAVAPNSEILRNAIKRETDLLSSTLQFIGKPYPHIPTSTSPVVQDFLKQVEALSTRQWLLLLYGLYLRDHTPASSCTAASGAAYELVDWMRVIHAPLHASEVRRLLTIILRFWPPATMEFLYQLEPQLGYMWSISEELTEVLRQYLPFEWAYLHLTPAQVAQERIQTLLVSLFFANAAWNSSLERRITIVMHRLMINATWEEEPASSRQVELSLLTSIMRGAPAQKFDLSILKRTFFLESDVIRDLCHSMDISDEELATLSDFVRTTLDHHVKLDRELALEYCNYWIAHTATTTSLRLCTLASPWISFMESASLIKFLDIIISAVEGGHRLTDLEQVTVDLVLDALTRSDAQLLANLQHRSHGLLSIREALHRHATIDTVILLIVELGLPLGCNTLLPSIGQPKRLSDVALCAQERWSTRSFRLFLDQALVSTFVRSGSWDKIAANLVAGAIHRSSAARRVFSEWITSVEPPDASSLEVVVIALHAYLDVMSLQRGAAIQLSDAWLLALLQCLFRIKHLESLHRLCASCIRMLFQAMPSSREHFADQLLKEIRKGHDHFLNSMVVQLLRSLRQLDAVVLMSSLTEISDDALKWMARQFSEGTLSEDELSGLDELVSLVACTETKAHLVEPVLKAAIQDCLHMPNVIRSLVPLLLSTHLKPAFVNRQLQSIVQHSELYRVADPSLPTREPIVKLLHTLFYIHPTNTCQPSHIIPLMQLYNGSLSFSDRLLLSIFYLYEKQRKESTASIFRHWSPSLSTRPSQDALRAIIHLDPSKVFRTCSMFPTRRRLDVTVTDTSIGGDSIYDPVFLTLLVVQMVSENEVISTTDWVQLFRSNVISLVVCVLTSRDGAFRAVGVTTLAGVLERVRGADFLEKDQVIYTMDILRDLLPSASSTSSAPRLPTYPVMLIAHALRAIFYPSSFLYPLVSRFLLQRPELDITDVPMLYSLLYSSEDGEWTKERTWMIRFLTEAMNEGGAKDWMVLKRRHTWDLVASMWQASKLEERSLRKGILEFLANLSSNRYAITSLIGHSSLLTWIEMQLRIPMASDAEYVAWVKILENIIITADGHKANRSTSGEYEATLIRCLRLILHSAATSDSLNTFIQIGLLKSTSQVLLRVANQAISPTHALAGFLEDATHILRRLEPLIAWTTGVQVKTSVHFPTMPELPHRARGLFDLPDRVGNDSQSDGLKMLRAWAEIVVMLWKVAMVVEQPGRRGSTAYWDALTCRLLIVQASPWTTSQSLADDRNPAEWARRETLRCLLLANSDDVETNDH